MEKESYLNEIEEILKTGAAQARKEAVQELIPYGRQALNLLTLALKDGDKGVRDAAFHALTLIPCEEAAAQLVAILGDKNIEIRNLANELLIHYGAAAVKPLIAALKSTDKDVRKFSVDILGLSQDSSSASHLIPLLEDPEPNVAVSAAEALGNLRVITAVPALIQSYQSYKGMQPVVLEALSKLSCPAADQFLLQVVKEGNLNASLIALSSLTESRDFNTAQKLAMLLPSLGPVLKSEALKAIFCIADHLDVDPHNLLDLKSHKTEIFKILAEENNPEDFNAIFAKLANDFLYSAIEDVLLLLNHQNDEIRYSIADRIRSIADEEVFGLSNQIFDELNPAAQLALASLLEGGKGNHILSLLERLARSSDPYVKITAAQCAATIEDDRADAIIKGLLRDNDEKVQEAAYHVFSYRAKADFIPLFEKGLNHESKTIREVCVQALLGLKPKMVSGLIKEWLAGDSIENLELALQIVTQEPGIVSWENISRLLQHPKPEIRAEAIKAMENFDGENVWQAVYEMLKDADRDVRLSAFYVLLNLSPDEAEIPIKAAFEDEDFWIQIVALETVTNLNRKDLAPNIYPLLGSSDRMVQIRAIQALLRLLGTEQTSEMETYLENLGEDANTLINLAREEIDAVS